MGTVRISDVKSKSQNVITLFKTPMEDRTFDWLEKQHYTNDELLEILKLSETIEKHDTRIQLYERLILSHTGPFNVEVFRLGIRLVYEEEVVLWLLAHTINLTGVDKTLWIHHAFRTEPNQFRTQFFLNGESSKYGIDIHQDPCNKAIALCIIMYDTLHPNSDVFTKPELLWSVLDSMSDSKKMEWYNAVISKNSNDDGVSKLLVSYTNTPADILTKGYNQLSDVIFKHRLVTHKNFPYPMKLEMYKSTESSIYLSEYLKLLFIF